MGTGSPEGTNSRGPATGRVLKACLEAAIAAPSIHNTQPWRFRIRPGVIDVYADPTRRLDVVDPRGREMMISVGAAILNLRVAILNHGRVPLAQLLPDPADPYLVARVRIGDYTEPDRTVRALAEAIPHRRTNRRPFTRVDVAAETIAELIAAAATEGAQVQVADDDARRIILDLVRSAEHQWRTSASYRAELSDWTSNQPTRRDGVPRAAIGPWDAMETLPLRDFGVAFPLEPRRTASFEAEPILLVLSTEGDDTEHWLRTGQALERLLLTATVRSLATTPMSQPLEIPEFRRLLTAPNGAVYPQVVLRVGYGRASPPTPRRNPSELVTSDIPEP